MNFSSIPGLEETKRKLTSSVQSNHIAHALLFGGKEGSLNLPLALAFAQYLHCTNKNENDACGVCPACSKSLKYVHPDTHFVFPLGNISSDKDEDRSSLSEIWRNGWPPTMVKTSKRSLPVRKVARSFKRFRSNLLRVEIK